MRLLTLLLLKVLTISATLLLNPILLHLSLPIQRLLSAICYTIGVFSFAAGLIRFALTRPGITYDSAAPINLDLEERGLLWLSLQTAAVVIVGNCITFKDVVEDKKEEDATPAGPGAGAGVRPPPKREQIGVGVWRETKSKGKGSKRVESEAAGWG